MNRRAHHPGADPAGRTGSWSSRATLKRCMLVSLAVALVSAVPFSGASAAGQIPLVAKARAGAANAVPPVGKARARAANAVPPVAPLVGRPFYPTIGDWEGTVNGFPASFETLFEPQYEVVGLPPYGYEDVVVLGPRSCPPRGNEYRESFISAGQASRVQTGGSFGLSRVGFTGGLTGARSASLSSAFHISSGRGCRGRVTWRLHPARRRTVQDGTWKLRFGSGGGSTSFSVRAGGRLATSVRLAPQVAACGGPLGAIDLFIGAGGTAAVDHPHALKVVLHFSRRSAIGEMTVPGGRCANPNVALRASLTKRSS